MKHLYVIVVYQHMICFIVAIGRLNRLFKKVLMASLMFVIILVTSYENILRNGIIV